MSQHRRRTRILATLCPANKKIIHGMTDAIMAPCTMATSAHS